MNAKINSEIKGLARPLADLHLDKNNRRTHGGKNIAAIMALLAQHGQQFPIVVDKEGKILAGEGRFRSATALGWDHLAAVTYDGDESKAGEFALGDNRSAELADWDVIGLSEDLAMMVAEDRDPTPIGWDDEDIRILRDEEPMSVERERPDTDPDVVMSKDATMAAVTEDQRDQLHDLAGYRTAMARTEVSVPMSFWADKGMLVGDVLDYGGGQDPHAFAKFDPYWSKNEEHLTRTWDVVTCCYVLNVIPLSHDRFQTLVTIRSLVREGGRALIAIWKKGDDDTSTDKGVQVGQDSLIWEAEIRRVFPKAKKIKNATFMGWDSGLVKPPK